MASSLLKRSALLACTLAFAACAAPADEDVDEATGAATGPLPLSYVGEAITSALDAKYASEKGSTWSLSRDGKLTGEFVKQFPPRATWGQSSLSVANRCAAGDASCDPDFLLRTCQRDTDCGGAGTCVALQSTIAHRGAAPKALCVGHSEVVLDEIWSTITSAKKTLDLSSLGPPDGRFEAAVRNAITYASESASPPRVRIVVGDYWTSGLQRQSTIDGVLARLTRDVVRSSTIDVSVNAYAYGQSSWDHAKILARDGEYALIGGANLWDEHYLGQNPVHDLWIAVQGGPAADAQRFIDRIFRFVCVDRSPYLHLDVVRQARRNGSTECPVSFEQAQGAVARGDGRLPVITVGRTGFAQNPSDDAFLAMINAARTKIHLSQQDIGPIHRAGVSFGGWPDELLKALMAAMGRGVHVDFILSNTGAVPGTLGAIESLYNTYDNGWTPAAVAQKFVAVAAANPGLLPPGTDARALVCAKLQLMRLRSSASETWPDGHTLANHAKVIMVDDQAFYVGSQNAYAANLTELGVIVDDAASTRAFVAQYLANAEKFSRRTAISGSGATCSF